MMRSLRSKEVFFDLDVFDDESEEEDDAECECPVIKLSKEEKIALRINNKIVRAYYWLQQTPSKNPRPFASQISYRIGGPKQRLFYREIFFSGGL